MFDEPFGHANLETEYRALKGKYQEVYLADTAFAGAALDHRTYLIVGRRGSGKTALASYFAFQKQIPNLLHVPIGAAEAYPRVLSALSEKLTQSPAVAIPLMIRIWNWAVIVAIDEAVSIARSDAKLTTRPEEEEDAFTAALNLINGLLDQTHAADINELNNLLHAKAELDSGVRAFANLRKIVVTIDTLEKYDTNDTLMMRALAALVQYAAAFQQTYSPDISLKVFVPGELYSSLTDEFVLNPVKVLRRPLHLRWSAPQLLRLISWRFWRYLLLRRPFYRNTGMNVRWSDPRDVYRTVWCRHFTPVVTGGHGTENSLQYLLRHTQMLPRQLIYICNAIAARAGGREETFLESDILEGVNDAVDFLISDVINAYSATFPRLSEIIAVWSSSACLLTYEDVQRRAEWSRESWPVNQYSIPAFIRLMIEIGLLGRVLEVSGDEQKVVIAEFAQSNVAGVVVGRGDQYAIHPMFHRRLNINRAGTMVLPSAIDVSFQAMIG